MHSQVGEGCLLVFKMSLKRKRVVGHFVDSIFSTAAPKHLGHSSYDLTWVKKNPLFTASFAVGGIS